MARPDESGPDCPPRRVRLTRAAAAKRASWIGAPETDPLDARRRAESADGENREIGLGRPSDVWTWCRPRGH